MSESFGAWDVVDGGWVEYEVLEFAHGFLTTHVGGDTKVFKVP
jgi:hypothetical protein